MSPNLRPGEFKYTTYGRPQLSLRRLPGFTLTVVLGSMAFWLLVWVVSKGVWA